MGLSLTVLGCSGTYSGPGMACSGYLVRSDTTTIWIDAGSGTLANLQQHVGVADVDAVVISHEHPDHWLDLPVYRNVCKYVEGLDGVPVFLTAGTLAMLEVVCPTVHDTFDLSVVAGGDAIDVGDIELRFSETDHPVETLAVLAQHEGRSVAYSADTGPGWSFDAFGDPVTVALCEASLATGDEAAGVHMTGAEAGRAASGSAERLLLTHVIPGGDAAERVAAAKAEFGGQVGAVTANQTYEI